jgi:hypothetical protein
MAQHRTKVTLINRRPEIIPGELFGQCESAAVPYHACAIRIKSLVQALPVKSGTKTKTSAGIKIMF